MTTKITTQIKGPIEDIIASYESAANVRCIGYSTCEGWITLEFKEIEPEPEPEPENGDAELLNMIRRAFDALGDMGEMERNKVERMVKTRKPYRWEIDRDED